MGRTLLGAGLAAALLVGAPPAVLAEPPQDLQEQVSDLAGVLSPAQEDQVERAFARLEDEHGITFHVVLVGSFDGVEGPAWSERTFERSSLGTGDALLAVAVDDRRYGYAEDTEVTSDRAEEIAVDDVEPLLRESDWAGAAVAAAEGYAIPTSGWSDRAVATLVGSIGSVLALAGGGLGLHRLRRRRRGSAAVLERRGSVAARLGPLREQVEQTLAEEGYVQAQLGARDARWVGREAGFAQDDVDNALAALEQVPRSTGWWPPSLPTTRTWSGLVDRAGQRLDRAQDRLTEVADLLGLARELARDPGLLDTVAQRHAALDRRRRATREPGATTFLRRRVPELVAGAAAELDAGEEALRQSRALLSSGRHVDAARSLGTARERLATAGTTLDLADDPRPEVQRARRELERAVGTLVGEIGVAEEQRTGSDELRRDAFRHDLEGAYAGLDLPELRRAVQQGRQVRDRADDDRAQDDPEAARAAVERAVAALQAATSPFVLLRARVDAAEEAAEAARAASSSSGYSSSGGSSSSSSFSSGGGRF